jgi:hypothetical protein
MSGLDKRPFTAKDIMPKYIGGYTIVEGFVVSTVKKPNWFHRTMCKLILGWEWRDSI